MFIEQANDYILGNNIQTKPTIYSMDAENFFPSVIQALALPAINKTLLNRKLSKLEVSAVIEGLKVVRDGNFFRWRDQFFTQVSGCALGDADSCSYTDIAMADLLDRMIPSCEIYLSSVMDPSSKYSEMMVLALPLMVLKLLPKS